MSLGLTSKLGLCLSLGQPTPLPAFINSPISLADNFNDDSFDTSIWNAVTAIPGWSFDTVSGTRTESGGVLSLTPTGTTNTIIGASSVSTFNVTAGIGKTAFVHLKTAPVDSSATFGFWLSLGKYVRFEVSNSFGTTNIGCLKSNAGNNENLLPLTTYNAVTDQWLAIHYNVAAAAFQAWTAPYISGPWTLRGITTTALFTLTSLRAGIFNGSHFAAPTAAIFDGFCTSD